MNIAFASCFSALESLVNFAYCGKIQFDPTNVQSVLVAANFLHLQVPLTKLLTFI